MNIPRESVEHVARLAHIALTPEEVEEFSVELSSILEHVARLNMVDTESVPPTSHVVDVENVLREDEVRPSWPIDAVLANAPNASDKLFAVKAIFD